jgi:hypothetical protein
VVIINQNYGQLGNRLFLYAHMLAYGMENNRKVFYPGFFDRLESFPKLKSLSIKNQILGDDLNKSLENLLFLFFRRFFHHRSKPMRFFEYVTRRSFHMRLDPLQDFFYPEFDASYKVPCGLCFFEGWAFRMHKAFRRHSPTIRSLFQFDETIQKMAQQFLEKFQGGLTVGIHVRRGDYASAAPQWVYPDEYWIDAINRIKSTSTANLTFIVVSDDRNLKIDLDSVYRFAGSDILDLAVLSKCDFVMGPPSTFNRWAAFVGEKPHYCCWNSEVLPSFCSFKKFKMILEKPLSLSKSDMETVRWFGII